MGRLILVRHGETPFNASGTFCGIKDPSLTEKGEEQARKAKEILKNFSYGKIYSSDLKRASQTAKIINVKEIEIVKTSELREINFGIFEGFTYNELLEKYPEDVKKSKDDWRNYNYRNGESVKELQDRAINFIENNINLDEDTVLVTHWGVINTILSYYFSNDVDSYWKFDVKNGGIAIIEFLEGYPILKAINIGGF